VANEFGDAITCGQTDQKLVGGQRYYRVELVKGQSYRIQLTPLFFFVRLAIFREKCEPLAINNDCSSKQGLGLISHTIHRGQTFWGVFTASQSGPYIFAVDSTAPKSSGSFVFTLEKTQLYTNNQCSNARLLDLSGGPVTANGNTLGASNEFGGQIKCGGKEGLIGPQLYYQMLLTPDMYYEVILDPDFPTQVALFGSNCSAAAIEKDCASKGLTGDLRAISGSDTTLQFRASQALMTVAVDSQRDLRAGAFTLTVRRHYPPPNSTCASATSVDLSSGSATIQGDTTGAVNEFGGGITCNLKETMLYGNQVYYKVDLTAGKATDFVFQPAFGNAWIYLFSGTCTAPAINSDCSSNGKTGFVAGAGASSPAKVTFTPSTSGTYTLAVDTADIPARGSGYGAFTIEIKVGN
jgi:hypothetical protein